MAGVIGNVEVTTTHLKPSLVQRRKHTGLADRDPKGQTVIGDASPAAKGKSRD